MVLWSSLVAAALILAFSCKKQSESYNVYEGVWWFKSGICSQNGKTLEIRNVKTYGGLSKKINKYEVVSGHEIFYCVHSNGDDYFFDNFYFYSSVEGIDYGKAHDGKDIDLQIVNDDLIITYNGIKPWKVYLKRL